MPRKTLISLFSLALLAATVLAPAVEAQRDRQRGEDGQGRRDGGRRGQFGGGFGRGGGGFGGGGFGGGGAAILGLLRVDAVRTEIKLTEDQQELVEILGDELREGRPDFPQNYRDLSDAEQEAFREKMRKATEEQTAQARDTLKTILEEAQFKRLEEISLQTQGVRALLTPEVSEALKLTEEQKTKLQETQQTRDEASRTAMQEAFQAARAGGDGGGFDRDAMREKMETARKETEEQMLAALTADQKAAFASMKGKTFEMPEGGFGFGRGGRGGDRGGRGRGDGQGGTDGNRPRRPE